jgi:hypothetical protein
MADYAWMSVATVSSDTIFALRSEAALSEDQEVVQSHLAACRASENGKPIPDGLLPKVFFAWRGPQDDSTPLTKRLPHLAQSGFWFVSSDVATVMQQFDLGGCKLHPVEILMEDRKTPLPGRYLVLDFNSWKDVFLPDHSPEFLPPRGTTNMWKPSLRTKDDAAALSRKALDGADIWWSPNVYGAFFLSDRLAQALSRAGVNKPFTLRRCRIV